MELNVLPSPGFRVNLNETEFRDALRNVGLGMIGQTADVAPADKALYALRDVTGTVESVPLITASILSKKLSEGIDALVLDVKCGCGAFMKTLADARILAESLVRVATLNGLRCEAIITSMDTPLGMAIGNTLEVIESIETLKGNGPADLEELSVALAARMVRLAGCAPTDAVAESLVRKAIQSGEGVERFRKMVAQQGGDPRIVDDYSLLPQAPHRTTIPATRSGWITRIDAEAIGIAAMMLGAGRMRSDDTIDPAVGIVLRVKPGDSVRVGDAVLEVHHRGVSLPVEIQSRIESGYTIGETSVGAAPSILEYLT